jgi:hypothetical protein
MRFARAVVVAALFLHAPHQVEAAVIDASLIPDGTYVVVVEKIVDNTHILVKMDNGQEAVFQGDGVDFGGIKPDQRLKVSVVRGKIPVYRAE